MQSDETIKEALLSDLQQLETVEVVRKYRNPPLPSKVLLECFEDDPGNTPFLRFATAYPDTPSVLLTHIFEFSSDLDAQAGLAAHHRTPQDSLTALADSADEQVRRTLGGNPQTPPQALETLAGDASWRVRQTVAVNPSCPIRLQESFLSDISCVRTSLLMAGSLPQHIRDEALQSLDAWTAAALVVAASNGDAMLELADTDNRFIQHQLLRRRSLPDSVLESLSFSPHENVHHEAIRRRALSSDESVGWALAGDDALRIILADKQDLPECVQDVLARDDSETVRSRLARNTAAAHSAMAILSTDPSMPVRMALACNPSVPENVLDILLASGEVDICKALAQRADLQRHHLEYLVNTLRNDEVIYHLRISGYLYRHICEEMIDRLSKHRLPRVREFVAGSYNLPMELQSRLRIDVSGAVRAVLAANPSVQPQILTILSSDNDPAVARTARQTLSLLEQQEDTENVDVFDGEWRQAPSLLQRIVRKIT